ncbi:MULTISPECIES: NAD(P)H-dependent glycerol-3-phosphate dehydrogenase [Bacteroides]|nr:MULTISPECIES: NAD(P)H-dependent glycerol-3-phosphate dehydrogenase [Bacteroides]HJD92617.1 NAD(P)H-dependent glycerol-3-phosphate dehydrogenase [Bacteroides coprosuis]
MEKLGRIAIIGGGSWATAIAKIVLSKKDKINWYMHREDRIIAFKEKGHNPAYLTNVNFDINKINFSNDINKTINTADTLIFVTPSPYLKDELKDLTVSLENKLIVTAIKGIIPGKNLIVSDFFSQVYHVSQPNIAVIGGPCHAEEVAKHKLSYLTVSCTDLEKAKSFSNLLTNDYVRVTTSKDVAGVEYGSVLKNVYAIAAGIYYGLGYGDNFHAVLLSNSILEMDKFLNKVYPLNRNVCESVYLGDLLVTGYSKYSRNRRFGHSIGQGHSVEGAQAEMGMVAEGYYGTKCIYEINLKQQVDMPILQAVYKVLYQNADPRSEMKLLTNRLK